MKEKKLLLGAMLTLALGGMGLEGRELAQYLSQRNGVEQDEHNLLPEGSHKLAHLLQQVIQKRTVTGVADQALTGGTMEAPASKLPAGNMNAAGVIWWEAKDVEPYYQDAGVSSDYYNKYSEK